MNRRLKKYDKEVEKIVKQMIKYAKTYDVPLIAFKSAKRATEATVKRAKKAYELMKDTFSRTNSVKAIKKRQSINRAYGLSSTISCEEALLSRINNRIDYWDDAQHANSFTRWMVNSFMACKKAVNEFKNKYQEKTEQLLRPKFQDLMDALDEFGSDKYLPEDTAKSVTNKFYMILMSVSSTNDVPNYIRDMASDDFEGDIYE